MSHIEYTEIDLDTNIIDYDVLSYNNENSIMTTDLNNFNNLYNKNYEKTTIDYYQTLRLRKMDPIMNIDLDESISFKFSHMWDPYTGERTNLDPYGALCFEPNNLIYYFYINRLKNLWTEPENDIYGHYEGYYDMLVGCGKDINIIGRGLCPEKYLFRLPIMDCYLEKEYNMSIITMGPILTENEIEEIDRLSNDIIYKKMFNKEKPSLIKMKKLYDEAIHKDKNNIKSQNTELQDIELQDIEYKKNCLAVENLKKM